MNIYIHKYLHTYMCVCVCVRACNTCGALVVLMVVNRLARLKEQCFVCPHMECRDLNRLEQPSLHCINTHTHTHTHTHFMHILSICFRRTFEKTSMLKVSLYLPPSPPLSHTLSLSLSHIASFFETPQLLPRLPPDHFPLMLSFLLWRPCQSARWASRSAACWMMEVQTCRFSEARARLRFGTSSVLIPETRHMHTHVFTHAHTHTRFRQSLRFCKRRIKQLTVGVSLSSALSCACIP